MIGGGGDRCKRCQPSTFEFTNIGYPLFSFLQFFFSLLPPFKKVDRSSPFRSSTFVMRHFTFWKPSNIYGTGRYLRKFHKRLSRFFYGIGRDRECEWRCCCKLSLLFFHVFYPNPNLLLHAPVFPVCPVCLACMVSSPQPSHYTQVLVVAPLPWSSRRAILTGLPLPPLIICLFIPLTPLYVLHPLMCMSCV